MPRVGVISDTHGPLRPEALRALDLDPRAAGFDAVIAGHSHQPRIERRHGVLYLNPGSAGPRRFRLPIAVARLDVDGTRLHAEILPLDV